MGEEGQDAEPRCDGGEQAKETGDRLLEFIVEYGCYRQTAGEAGEDEQENTGEIHGWFLGV